MMHPYLFPCSRLQFTSFPLAKGSLPFWQQLSCEDGGAAPLGYLFAYFVDS